MKEPYRLISLFRPTYVVEYINPKPFNLQNICLGIVPVNIWKGLQEVY